LEPAQKLSQDPLPVALAGSFDTNLGLMPSRCSTFSASLHRFQPGGLLEAATDGKRGMVTTLPS
jgi:hypothetical protein